MTRRAGGAGLVAAGTVAGAWLVGSTAIAIVGLGLAITALAGRLWARLVTRGLVVERRPTEAARIEGQPLRLEIAVHGRRWLASRVEWRDTLGQLGERHAAVSAAGIAAIEVEGIPRGRYRIGPGRLVVDDPLGLGRVVKPGDVEATVLVRPYVPELPSLFSERGAWGEGGRRAQLRRPSGLEPHGVREYVEGEPLRAVHWPTSARRGQLMVRDLEDAPRDSVAVVVDVDASEVVGPPGRSSLDDAARAAAGLLRAHVVRSRSALLVVASPQPGVHRIRSLGRDWDAALDALAAAEPVSGAPLHELLTRGVLATVPDLVVLTGRPAAVADAVVARQAVGRASALVVLDTPTYAGRPPSQASAVLLRLSAAGVPIAVVRLGDSLLEALTGLRERAVG